MLAWKLVLSFLVALAYFSGGQCDVSGRVHVTGDVTWMMTNDAMGTPQLVVISGPTPTPRADVVLRDNVTFQLYTRSNRDAGYQLYVDDEEGLQGSGFDPDLPTKVLVHGFTESLDVYYIQDMKDDYLTLLECNVLCVGYGPLVPWPLYNVAKPRSLLVGRYLALLLDLLVNSAGARLDDFHMVGHSLGAHVAGIAAANVTRGTVARITALDPAMPLFDSETDDNRIDPSDAKLVDVVHSDGGLTGFLAPQGHVDFYPNKGKQPQPGCIEESRGWCSHRQSHIWYLYSIAHRDVYPAIQCSSLDEATTATCTSGVQGMMGDNIGDTAHGIYYLEILPQ